MNVLRLFWKVLYTNISVIFHLCKVYTVITQSGTALFVLAILNITRIHSVFTYMFIARQDRHLQLQKSRTHIRAAIHTIRWHKRRSPFYHHTETDSHTLKDVVKRFGFSLTWLLGMHEWQAWRDALLLFLSPRSPR